MSAAPEAAADGSDWTRTPEHGNATALKLMRWFALRCGRRAARLLLHPITLWFLLVVPGPKRHSRRYLQRVLGRSPRWSEVYGHLHAFAATVLDRVYLLDGRLGLFDIRVEGGPLIDATLVEGRGAFLVGAHVGSFEALHACGRGRPGMRIAMVMYPANARLIGAALAAIAPTLQPEIIALGRVDSMLAIRDWLDAGGLAGMLGDRSLPDAASERAGTIRLDFLGQPAEFSDGPFRLAALLRRRVIFMAGIYRGGARYDVCFEPLADFSGRLDAAERERRIARAVSDYAARLEALCRAQPDNWFNFHDFWHEDLA